MGMRRLFIIRKDLHLTKGKLSAMIGHCSEAYWTNLLKSNTVKVVKNRLPCVTDKCGEKQVQLYKRTDLCNLSIKAFEEGKSYFLYKKLESGEIIESDKEEYSYSVQFSIDKDIFENYINDMFVKTICEAKNLNHLLKVIDKAKELGLVEGRDYELINDLCLTELEPENKDGTCTVGIWFKPLDDEIARTLSKKYQLYKE